MGREIVKLTDDYAGKGRWKKRRPLCNEVDRNWEENWI